jgi:phosphoserine phosphatase RsbU/P
VSLASVAALRIRNIALAEEAAARQSDDRELALAHEIQMGLLPGPNPERAEVQLAATLVPARSVGGDLYDFIVIDDALWFIVAAASGRGVSAALSAVVTRTLFRALAQTSQNVSDVTSRMNEELARDGKPESYVTAFIGRLDLSSGELRYTNAGQLPPLISTGDRPFAPLSTPGGSIALGNARRAIYEEQAITLAPGNVLLAFTGGVSDAVNMSGESSSDARLQELFGGLTGEPPQEIVDRVMKAVSPFAAGAPQHEDITILALQYRGN